MYSMAYGTPPIVRRTGGLADSVTDTGGSGGITAGATGFIFDAADTASLLQAIHRAQEVYSKPAEWLQVQRNGMTSDFSWEASADHYLELYRQLLGQ